MILKNYKLLWTIITLLLLVIIFLYYSLTRTRLATISDFESCAAAGNPIMEIYPPQCMTKDGRVFTQDVRATPSPATKNGKDDVVCTLEAKLCPDGSYVGRTGPNCEFTPCP